MKKIILGVLIVLSILIPTYTILFWEPKGNGIDNESLEVFNEIENSNETTEIQSLNVLKCDYGEIRKGISKDKYEEIKDIVYTMSSADIGRVMEAIELEDKEEATKKVFKILSKRLSNEKLDRIKEILNPYVDFEVLRLNM